MTCSNCASQIKKAVRNGAIVLLIHAVVSGTNPLQSSELIKLIPISGALLLMQKLDDSYMQTGAGVVVAAGFI